MLRVCFTILNIFIVVCITGCITYDDVVFEVVDGRTREPIVDTYISLQWQGVMMRGNARELDGMQSGYTNEDGAWKANVPINLHGIMFVNKEGYAEKQMPVTPDTLNDRNVLVELQEEEKKAGEVQILNNGLQKPCSLSQNIELGQLSLVKDGFAKRQQN